MKPNIMKRWLAVFALAAVLSGPLLGSGVALAADYFQNLYSGWNYLQGYMDETPWWSYNGSHWEWMNAGRTQVNLDDTRYWNGYGDGYGPTFGRLWVYDEYGYDTGYFDYFMGLNVNGANYNTSLTDWTMDKLSAANNNVICQQMINYRGSVFSDNIIGTIP